MLADGAGTVVHLGERECSIQRRHQKVIEEAPSPLLDEETRAAMGAQACALAAAVGYRSAGTVEFVADQKRNFYFLEMNTRLQVEHPITELVTGIDLVEQQIRIAAGEPLSFSQNDIGRNGWAMECRIYAEDPARGFVPSIGRLSRYREPAASETCRVDAGVDEGSEISMFYDPMIAKLVTHGPDRPAAITAMQDALDRYEIRGVAHNAGFLNAVLCRPRFAEGRLSTAFIEEEFGERFDSAELTDEARAVLVPVAAVVHARLAARAGRISGQIEGLPPVRHTGEWVVDLGTSRHGVRIDEGAGGIEVVDGERTVPVASDWQPHESLFTGSVAGNTVTIQVQRRGTAITLGWRGCEITAHVRTPRAAELAATMPAKEALDLSRFLLSPMPGLVVALPASEGDTVRAGQPLAIVDAMKMENVLRAERDGRIVAVRAKVGDSLAADQVIMEFAAEE